MNAILLAITGVSLLLAGFMSAIAWRVGREERRRSNARVAVLAAALYEDDGNSSVLVNQLLEQPAADSWRRSLIAATAGVCAVAVIGTPAILVTSQRSAKASRSSSDDARSGSARLQPNDDPLELLVLEHERDGERLVVRGIVRNPPSAAERDGLDAVVLLVGRDGDVVASARAALAADKLAPGATTPFVVSVTNAGSVDRFRVSFRSQARIEPHVDRRTS
jgi:hypothetical protein